MKLFKKTAMSLALGVAVTSGALMMGVSAPVQAVNIAQNGLGQVLVFPYYTTRNGWNTYFNITNTSNKTVAIKVRWREGMNSRDARDFNVVLSPYDVWTAAVVNGEDGAAKVVTSDNSCTAPLLKSMGALKGVSFTNTAYVDRGTQKNDDHGSKLLDRTREGYFEVFNMGAVDRETRDIAKNAKHRSGIKNNKAVPKDCEAVSKAFLNIPKLQNEFNKPENVLKGRAVLINTKKGVAAGYDPLVLANFNTDQSMIANPSDPRPNLTNVSPNVSVTVDDSDIGNPRTISHRGGSDSDAVSQLILRNGIINDYNIATTSKTDWILTFPTKGFYVDKGYHTGANFAAIPSIGSAPKYPFDVSVHGERFSGVQDGKSCFDVRVSMWDREEYRTKMDENVSFSPREPGEEGDRMCYEANILSFGDSNMFGSKLAKSFFKDDPTQLPGENGWAKVTFGEKGTASLPVIGIRVEMRNKGSARANFGFANDHAYTSQKGIIMPGGKVVSGSSTGGSSTGGSSTGGSSTGGPGGSSTGGPSTSGSK